MLTKAELLKLQIIGKEMEILKQTLVALKDEERDFFKEFKKIMDKYNSCLTTYAHALKQLQNRMTRMEESQHIYPMPFDLGMTEGENN